MKTQYDVIIVGNGPVGSAMACALNQTGLRVALLQKQAILTKPEEDWRPISLNYASLKIVESLAGGSNLVDQAVPIQRVLVTQQGHFGALDFVADRLNVPMLGAVLSFDRLSESLYKKAIIEADVYTVTDIETIEAGQDSIRVTLNSGVATETISASLLVAADGAHSACRQKLGVSVNTRSSKDQSIAFELQLSDSHNNQAWQRFTADGTLAIVPLREANVVRLVWTLSDRLAKKVDAWSAVQLQSYFNEVYRGYCPRIQTAKRLQSYVLQTSMAETQCQRRSVLMGNAARTFYPTTAQGFNLALRDVATLAQLMVQSSTNQNDIGRSQLLDQYLAWREPDQKKVMQMTADMNAIFGLQLPMLSAVRGMGLAAIELLPFMKARLAKRLLGLSGKVPDMALGVPLFRESV